MKKNNQLQILKDDPDYIVVNKPPGLASVPIEGSTKPSALSVLNQMLEVRRKRAFIVHRIDRFTSGILLFAKNIDTREQLIRQFLAHSPVREYLAVVRGRLQASEGRLEHYMKRVGQLQVLTNKADSAGALATLSYKVEKEFQDYSLVRVKMESGLQNQIRVQFMAIGHTLVGDRKYSEKEAEETRIDRLALHACRLEFKVKKNIIITCETPSDFNGLLGQKVA